MKAIEQYFLGVLFIMLYKMALTFEFKAINQSKPNRTVSMISPFM